MAHARFPTISLELVAALAVFSVTGCDSGPTEPEPGGADPESISVSADPNPVDMPTQVQVSAQVLPGGAPQGVTWSSSDTDMATVGSDGVVTPLLAGTVTITATSTDDTGVSGSVDITIECPDPRLVSVAPSGDTEWENWVPDPICFDYVVETNVDINDETLTIQPGTVVAFEEGVRMRVVAQAGLLAEGTEEEPIVLTGTEAERGWWEGLAIGGRDFAEHVLTWVTIEYTDGEVAMSGGRPANLKIGDDVTARLENMTLRESQGYGLFMSTPVEILGSGGHVLTANALGPAYTYGTEVEHLLRDGSELTGNDIDQVVVYPNNIADDDEWPFGSFRIEDPSGQNFNVLGSLVLGPGVEIRFEGDGELLRTMPGGGFAAVGTSEAPVLISGTDEVPGHWAGVQFIGTAHEINRLEHVVVEYGGGLEGKTYRANVMIETSGSGIQSAVTITNSILRGSEEFGMYAEVGTTLTDFIGNTVTGNALGSLAVDAPVVRFLTADNDFTGNAIDEITVYAGTNRNLTVDQTWHDLGVPYHMVQYNALEWDVVGVSLTLEPGVEMLFSPGLRMVITSGGYLLAEGTENNRITLAARGADWGGVKFHDGNGSFDYISISDGGDNPDGTNVEINTANAGLPPGSTVMFTGEVTMTGAEYNTGFGYGDTIAVGCIGPLLIPAGDGPEDHCMPPQGG